MPAAVQQATLGVAADLYRSSTGGGSIDVELLTSLPATTTSQMVRKYSALLVPWAVAGGMIG